MLFSRRLGTKMSSQLGNGCGVGGNISETEETSKY